MYAGRKVEEGDTVTLFDNPCHPYTRGLLMARPRITAAFGAGRTRLQEIPGVVPPLTRLPPGCRFAPRCALRVEHCRQQPSLDEKAPGQRAECWESHRMQAEFTA